MYRNPIIDYLKGVAIFLVVWAHCMQFLNKGYSFYENGIFMFIYSFHMPLFMTISGYLFAFSGTRTDLINVMKLKYSQLLLPIISWGIILTFIMFYKQILFEGPFQGAVLFFNAYLKNLAFHLWFLWALFIISTMISVVASKFNDSVLVHLFAFVLILFFPDGYGLIYVKFMYPFFLGGYFYNLFRARINKYKRLIIGLSFVVFPILLCYWSKQDLIYFSNMSLYKPDLLQELIVALKRYLIGFSGVVVMVTIIKTFFHFPKAKFIYEMGIFSLGIYILQTVLFKVIELFVPQYSVNYLLYTFVYSIIAAFFIIVTSIFFTRIISKTPIIGKALFGGRY